MDQEKIDRNRKLFLLPCSSKLASIDILDRSVEFMKKDFPFVIFSDFILKDGGLNVWRKFYAGRPEERAEGLNRVLFKEDGASIIWFLRGGRNQAEVFEHFPRNLNNEIKRELISIGFSDVTCSHYFFSNYYPNIKTIHGEVANRAVTLQENYEAVKSLLNGEISKYNDLIPLNDSANSCELIENTVILGGNLALTQRSLRTIWQPNFDGKIIILEDVSESSSNMIKLLNQLKACGLFNNAKAIVMGQIYGENEKPNCGKYIPSENMVSELNELASHYKEQNYFNLEINVAGNDYPDVEFYNFFELELKIGVEELPSKCRNKVGLTIGQNDDVTRLEASLLHFHQSTFLDKGATIIISFEDTKTPEVHIDHLTALKDFSKSLNIPFFKSELFGHRDKNLPMPLNSPSKLYRNTNANNGEISFTLESKLYF